MSRELEFERPVLELERQIEELRRHAQGLDRVQDPTANALPTTEDVSDDKPRGIRGLFRAKSKGGDSGRKQEGALAEQIKALELRATKLKAQIFSNLSRWQIVQLARHPLRPYTLDYLSQGFTDFVELHGDRQYGDDPSIVGGFARLRGEPLMVIGHQKGRTTNENVARNFGMSRPEGYRKALRLMQLADRFRRPIITLIDTPGAYPGIDAEERGQAGAIAAALEGMASLTVPVISVVIGEGGSGGALAIGVANRLLMLEYSIYSVISPEGCAAILFKDPSYAERAANALKLCAKDLLALGVADEVIGEGLGGAHRDPIGTAQRVADAVHRRLLELKRLNAKELRDDRYQRFRRLGLMSSETSSDLLGDGKPPPEEAAAPTAEAKA